MPDLLRTLYFVGCQVNVADLTLQAPGICLRKKTIRSQCLTQRLGIMETSKHEKSEEIRSSSDGEKPANVSSRMWEVI